VDEQGRKTRHLKERSKVYELTILAILAACNAALELTLGSYLHLIKFPLTGMVMVGINIIVYTAGYALVPKKGTIISMGLITALMNLLLGGSFKLWAIVAIFLESVIIELVILSLGFNFWSVITASIVTNVFGFVFTMFVYGIILGHGVISGLLRILKWFIRNPATLNSSLFGLGLLIVLIHCVVGAISGWFAWKLNPVFIIRGKELQNVRALE